MNRSGVNFLFLADLSIVCFLKAYARAFMSVRVICKQDKIPYAKQ